MNVHDYKSGCALEHVTPAWAVSAQARWHVNQGRATRHIKSGFAASSERIQESLERWVPTCCRWPQPYSAHWQPDHAFEYCVHAMLSGLIALCSLRRIRSYGVLQLPPVHWMRRNLYPYTRYSRYIRRRPAGSCSSTCVVAGCLALSFASCSNNLICSAVSAQDGRCVTFKLVFMLVFTPAQHSKHLTQLMLLLPTHPLSCPQNCQA